MQTARTVGEFRDPALILNVPKKSVTEAVKLCFAGNVLISLSLKKYSADGSVITSYYSAVTNNTDNILPEPNTKHRGLMSYRA